MPTRPVPLFRLQGDDRSFEVGIGTHRIGSSRDGDIVLPEPTVSRQHAILTVTAEGLAVEDRGSRNGTFVDGLRIERAAVAPGSVLRFGPVRLTAEAINGEDHLLAISRPRPVSDPSTAPSQCHDESTFFAGHDEGAPSRGAPSRLLVLVEGFLEHLEDASGEALRGALGHLVGELELAGAAVLEFTSDGEPLTVAQAGNLHPLPSREVLQKVEQRRTEDVTTAFFSSEPPAALTLGGAGAARLALVIWGEFASRSLCADLSRLLLLLWARHRGDEPGTIAKGRSERAREKPPELSFPPGFRPLTSPPMRSLYRQMAQVVDGEMPLLIIGETGVGKERIANILHHSSRRREKPFVAINCAAIPAELMEAEMFGIDRGVATGVSERRGKFELADGGTLFLDEVGETPLVIQAKLLRALQEREIQPVGGAPRPVDVRVIAATNAALPESIREKRFRQDLYYRLAGYVLEVPALRQGRDDVPILVEHFLDSVSQESGRFVRGVTLAAMRHLTAHDWPGNVRELEHEVRRLVYKCADGGVISTDLLSSEIRGKSDTRALSPAIPLDPLPLEPRLEELEATLIREALRRTEGNLTQAAKLLEITRNGLSKKMKRLGLER